MELEESCTDTNQHLKNLINSAMFIIYVTHMAHIHGLRHIQFSHKKNWVLQLILPVNILSFQLTWEFQVHSLWKLYNLSLCNSFKNCSYKLNKNCYTMAHSTPFPLKASLLHFLRHNNSWCTGNRGKLKARQEKLHTKKITCPSYVKCARILTWVPGKNVCSHWCLV